MDCDRDRQLYETLKSLTLDDVVALQQEWVKNRPYNYVILGDRNDIDMEYLKTLGPRGDRLAGDHLRLLGRSSRKRYGDEFR